MREEGRGKREARSEKREEEEEEEETFWGILGASSGVGGLLAASWEPLGPSWAPLRVLVGTSWASWEPLGASGGLLGASWTPLGLNIVEPKN